MVDTAALTDPDARKRLQSIRARQATTGVRVARLAATPGALLRVGRTIAFDVAPNRRIVAVGDRVGQHVAGVASWHARVEDDPAGDVELVLSTHGVVATLRAGTEVYAIEPLGGGWHTIARVDPQQLPPDEGLDFQLPPSDPTEPDPYGPPPSDPVTDNYGPYIKVLVAYTASAAAEYGDVPSLAQLAVNETNVSYQNSYIQATLLLAGTAQVSYSEAGRPTAQIITDLQGTTDGQMDNVHALRQQYRADVVVLLTSGTDICGRAAAQRATAASAFAVVNIRCVYLGNLTFAHEIGHLQGAWHDRYEGTANTAFAYGYGYVDPYGQWRTVMAVSTSACGGCRRVKYWSNPDVIYPGTSTPMGTTTYDNNARVLNSTSYALRDFIAPAAPSFQQVNYSSGQYPRFSWPTVPFATGYTVYRCQPSSGGYCSSVSTSYYNYGTSWAVDDVMRRIASTCSTTTRYYVQASDWTDGTSPASSQQYTMCVQ